MGNDTGDDYEPDASRVQEGAIDRQHDQPERTHQEHEERKT